MIESIPTMENHNNNMEVGHGCHHHSNQEEAINDHYDWLRCMVNIRAKKMLKIEYIGAIECGWNKSIKRCPPYGCINQWINVIWRICSYLCFLNTMHPFTQLFGISNNHMAPSMQWDRVGNVDACNPNIVYLLGSLSSIL